MDAMLVLQILPREGLRLPVPVRFRAARTSRHAACPQGFTVGPLAPRPELSGPRSA